ncbi:MAG: SDR family oxidoreductase [Ignavibacteriae bacterium]|nr:SDR family oxidoreductase [Ignavibacteriota bacterium]NOG98351.1 SDR family oxidoreductase [Ignavibacteriota bacterium]
MKKVLVAGATGYLGKFLVKELAEKNYEVSAITRNPKKTEELKKLGASNVLVAEVTDKSALTGICDNIDVVITAVGKTKQKDNFKYMDVDYQANKDLLDEAKRAGVQKFIYVSGLGSEKFSHVKLYAAKLKFEKELKKSGINYAIAYPGGFFIDMLEMLDLAKKGNAYLYGDGYNSINPIHGADVAEEVVKMIDGDLKEKTFAGPEVFSQREVMELAYKVIGKPAPKFRTTPAWLVRGIFKTLKLFTPEKVYGNMEFVTTVATNDLVATPAGSRKLEDFFKENK